MNSPTTKELVTNWSGNWPLERVLFAMAGTVTKSLSRERTSLVATSGKQAISSPPCAMSRTSRLTNPIPLCSDILFEKTRTARECYANTVVIDHGRRSGCRTGRRRHQVAAIRLWPRRLDPLATTTAAWRTERHGTLSALRLQYGQHHTSVDCPTLGRLIGLQWPLLTVANNRHHGGVGTALTQQSDHRARSGG